MRRQGNKIGSAWAAVLVIITLVGTSFSWSGVVRVDSVEIAGLQGGANNIALAFDRYALVTPFAPSVEPDEDADLSEFDNHHLYLVDTRKPNNPPIIADLQFCYYPTRVWFDEASSTVFVKGTEFVETEDGGYDPVDVIAQLQINLADDGKPVFSAGVGKIRIPGQKGDWSVWAPDDFVLGRNGSVLVFTNGSSLFTYRNSAQPGFVGGELYRVDLVPPHEYGPDFGVSHLGIHQETNTLIVTVTGIVEDSSEPEKGDLESEEPETEADKATEYFSELYFYELDSNGLVNLIKIVRNGSLPEGASITPGSNAVITSYSGRRPETAVFVTDNGWLCQVDLRKSSSSPDQDVLLGEVTAIELVPGLASGDSGIRTPRILSYDAVTRSIAAYNPGQTLNIVRPVYARPTLPGGRGRIVRPVYIRAFEAPVLFLAQFNKKGRVTRRNVIAGEFDEEDSIAGFTVESAVAQAFVTMFSGQVYLIDFAKGVDGAVPEFIARIGDRVDYVTFLSSRTSLVAISSFGQESDPETEAIEQVSGSLVVARVVRR